MSKSEDRIIKRVEDSHKVGMSYKDFYESMNKVTNRLSSGFESLDIALNGGFGQELYIMGAESSTGKSALAMSFAENLAKSKKAHVLYFALEMSEAEFIARGISKRSFTEFLKDSSKKAFTTGDILYWRYDRVAKAFTKGKREEWESYGNIFVNEVGENLTIVEGGIEGLCVKDIANFSYLFKKKNPDLPTVVFIDYLQLIKADPNDRSQSDRKTKMDVVGLTLKTLASQIGMPVFAISSVGRSGYGKGVGMGSLKESGDLEYTGGLILGWNWCGVTDCDDADKVAKEKALCKDRGFRKMKLDVLKSRNSERDQSVYFKYYPAYNYFEPWTEEEIFIPWGEGPFAMNEKGETPIRVETMVIG